MPFFSILVPVYNIEALLPATIASVMEQTFTDYEVILIDDGSTDNSGKLCDSYARQDSRISVIHQRNGGLACARNTGIKASSGKYIIILEGSDFFASQDTLELLNNKIAQSEPDIIFTLLQDVKEGTLQITNKQENYIYDGLVTLSGEELLYNLLKHHQLLAVSAPVNKIYRRKFILENQLYFYEGIRHDDDEWIPRAIALTKRSLFYNHVFYSALDWSNSFGRIKNDKGLTRKYIDLMFVADRCCKHFSNKYNNAKFLDLVYQHYIQFYIIGLTAFYQVDDGNCKMQIKSEAQKYKDVLSFGIKTSRINFKILFYISKIFGIRFVMWLLHLRY